jgi:hypothetical protein
MELASQVIQIAQALYALREQLKANDDGMRNLLNRVNDLRDPLQALSTLSDDQLNTKKKSLLTIYKLVEEIELFTKKYISESKIEGSRTFYGMFTKVVTNVAAVTTKVLWKDYFSASLADYMQSLNDSILILQVATTADTSVILSRLLQKFETFVSVNKDQDELLPCNKDQEDLKTIENWLLANTTIATSAAVKYCNILYGKDQTTRIERFMKNVAGNENYLVSVGFSNQLDIKEINEAVNRFHHPPALTTVNEETVVDPQGKGVYQGCMKDGKYHGHGVMKYYDCSVYDGEWHEGVRNGMGTLTTLPDPRLPHSTNIVSFTGHFSNDKPDEVDFFLADFDITKGDIPQGTIVYTDGSTYKGDVWGGAAGGVGRRQYCDGYTYIGSFMDEVPGGVGELRHSNGHSYSGDFSDAAKHGYGYETFPFGMAFKSFSGFYEDNLQDGEGRLVYVNGTCIEGEWKNGQIIKINKTTIPDYGYLVGNYDQGLSRFVGTLHSLHDNITTLTGSWVFDIYSGNACDFRQTGGSL